MDRLEVAVNSPVAFSLMFRKPIDADVLRESLTSGPDTVRIEFRGRVFVWHAFPLDDRPGPGNEAAGPTVTVVLEPGDDEVDVAGELERFLSAIAFAYRQPVVTLSPLVTETTDPYGPAVHRVPRTPFWGYTLEAAPARIKLRSDENVQLAVGYYREGVNASSPFYRFLALWNALEATFGVRDSDTRESRARDEFVRNFEPSAREALADRYPFPGDLAKALADESRHAIAHVLRRPGHRSVDPDSAVDRERLRMETFVLEWLMHDAVENTYPDAVEVEHA